MPLGSNGNVRNTCLRILRSRGFKLSVEGEMNGDEYPVDAIWIAELNGFKFMADNPIELLGLVAIYDHKKPESDSNYWWHVEGDDIWTELMEDAFPDSE